MLSGKSYDDYRSVVLRTFGENTAKNFELSSEEILPYINLDKLQLFSELVLKMRNCENIFQIW